MECFVIEGWKAWAFMSGGVMIGVFFFAIMSAAKRSDEQMEIENVRLEGKKGTP